MSEYFENLVPDYTTEIPNSDPASLEVMRRLLFMFKLAINGHMVALSDEEGNVVALSSEFLANFQWTLEEFQALGEGEFFHEDSAPIAYIHRENHLAAPYIARCYKKNSSLSYYKVQGLCVEFDGEHWRMLSFVKI